MYFHSAYDLEEQALQNQRTAREMARLILVCTSIVVRACGEAGFPCGAPGSPSEARTLTIRTTPPFIAMIRLVQKVYFGLELIKLPMVC